ncbi:MAG: helicase-related protein, partial [Verrucomicrobiota bacterium]|nr:helicase-related protein [Verrucomicrobiota bacterium]
PIKGQVEDVISEVRLAADVGERTLITTLTKRMSEDLSDYLRDSGLNVEYLHSDIDAVERVEILRRLRKGDFDVLVGVNLLREGLDLPEVALVAILDADKEGFLRSTTSLIQTAGRAARHIKGRVILYADTRTDSIKRTLEITQERREKQLAYNLAFGITPRGVERGIEDSLQSSGHKVSDEESKESVASENRDVADVIAELEEEMLEAARQLAFEKAAMIRDQINCLEGGRIDTSSGIIKNKHIRKKGKSIYNAAGLPRKRSR